jgi:hypothetical protein
MPQLRWPDMTPAMWLILVLTLATPVTYGYMWVKNQIEITRAIEKGEKIGEGRVAAATTKQSQETTQAVAEAESTALPAPRDKAKLQELCDRNASCRDRKK